MGQLLSALQGYINVMWATFFNPPRPALANMVSPKIRAVMEGYKGGKSATAVMTCMQRLAQNSFL